MKKLTVIAFTISFGFLLQGCGETESTSLWEKTVNKDQFSDKTSIIYLLKQKGKSASENMLGMACTKEKKIDFQWMVSDKSPQVMGQDFPMSVSIRMDDGSTAEESWLWSSVYPKILPQNTVSFLDKLIGKKKLALRENQTGSSAVFDLTGFDNAYSEVKTFCKK